MEYGGDDKEEGDEGEGEKEDKDVPATSYIP